MLAMELHLLVELGTHLRLLELNLLLNVFVRLDLKLGVDFSGKSFALLVDAQCFVIFQLLKFQLLLEFVLYDLLLFHRLLTLANLLCQLFFL